LQAHKEVVGKHKYDIPKHYWLFP